MPGRKPAVRGAKDCIQSCSGWTFQSPPMTQGAPPSDATWWNIFIHSAFCLAGMSVVPRGQP
eukprot:16442100-Heterocapsa_arctica.AAC.1